MPFLFSPYFRGIKIKCRKVCVCLFGYDFLLTRVGGWPRKITRATTFIRTMDVFLSCTFTFPVEVSCNTFGRNGYCLPFTNWSVLISCNFWDIKWIQKIRRIKFKDIQDKYDQKMIFQKKISLKTRERHDNIMRIFVQIPHSVLYAFVSNAKICLFEFVCSAQRTHFGRSYSCTLISEFMSWNNLSW